MSTISPWPLYGTLRAQPPQLALPQPWEPQPWTPYEARPRFEDPYPEPGGFYALPQPGWSGDPGIDAQPDPAWAGDPGIPTQPVPAWPSPFDAPPPTTMRPNDAARSIADIDAGEHVKHGAGSLLVPSIAAGVLVGAIGAANAPTLKGAVFGTRMAGQVIGGVASGAAMGLLVAASSPGDEDDLRARYAVAGGVVGAASGAIIPGGLSRPASIMLGGGLNAALGWMIGGRLQDKVRDSDG
jgi:hypothetical protein